MLHSQISNFLNNMLLLWKQKLVFISACSSCLLHFWRFPLRIWLQNWRLQKPFAIYHLYSMLRCIWLHLFVEFLLENLQSCILFPLNLVCCCSFLDPVMLEIWSNHYLKELYRFQIIFETAPIYTGGAL